MPCSPNISSGTLSSHRAEPSVSTLALKTGEPEHSCTYVAVCPEHEVRIRGLAHVLRTRRQILHVLPRNLPVTERPAAHEQAAEVLRGPGEAQQVLGPQVAQDLACGPRQYLPASRAETVKAAHLEDHVERHQWQFASLAPRDAATTRRGRGLARRRELRVRGVRGVALWLLHAASLARTECARHWGELFER